MQEKGWRSILLGEFVTLQRGFDITKKEQEAGRYKVYSSSGPNSTHSKYQVKGPGVIIGRKGTLGTAFYSDEDFWPHDTTLWVKDFHGNDHKFAYHFLKSMRLEQYDCGASNPTLNRNHIHLIPVSVPLVPIQQKIAAILSAYDDLIENNLRRIKILEEMAQVLYREWFVKFHFPSHQKVKMVNSPLGKIPERWEVLNVENIVKRHPPGKLYEQKTIYAEGTVPVLDQGRSGIIGYHNDSPGVEANEENPVIIFANHTCYQRIIHFPFSAIQNVLPFYPNPDHYRNIYWLHYATKDLISFNDYKGHWPEYMKKKVVVPLAQIAENFGGHIKTNILLTLKLQQKRKNLTKARDLLLPKLISGELDVSEFDINTGGLNV